MQSEDAWQLVIIRQERGTKNEQQMTLEFPDRVSAVKVAERLEAQAARGGNQPIAVESPDGTRVTVVAMDFRATKIGRFSSGDQSVI